MSQRNVCGRTFLCCLLTLATGTHAGNCQSQEQSSRDQLVREFLNQDSFVPQLEIAKEIISLQDPSTLPALAELLSHEDRHIRGNAALIFASLGDDRGFKIIEEMLSDKSLRPEGQGMALFLPEGGYNAEQQINADRFYAAHLFGVLKDPRAVPILIEVLDDRIVNYKALWSLGQIGDDRALDAMIGMLEHEDPSIRVDAIYALENLGDRRALPSLNKLLNDHERSNYGELATVAEAAKAAITKLEGSP